MPTETSIAIRARDVGKCYHLYDRPADRLKQMLFRGRRQFFQEFWALSDVSFEVPQGGCVGVIGRNGSGKSTLLQLVTGVLPCTTGSIETRGRIAALLELGAGFNPDFTGRENVFLNGALLGLEREEVEERFESILAFSEIHDFIDQPVKTYSSGMFMRLAFSVVAHVNADILIVDEALAVGDAFFVQKCMRFLREFKERGTLLFVSHDTSAVSNMCDTAIWLNDGRVEQLGDAKDVCEQYFSHRYSQDMGISISGRSKPAVRPLASATPAATLDAELDDTEPEAPPELLAGAQVLRGFRIKDDSASFGTGLAAITGVTITHEDGRPVDWLAGGEAVCVTVALQCDEEIDSPIVGFALKDRLGQALLGDNSTAVPGSVPERVAAGDTLQVAFHFNLPLLASGDYTISAAVASGTMQTHVQHHWVHDALVFRVHSPSLTGVLVGVPVLRIESSTAPP